MGCGTGILGILCEKIGAVSIDALYIDQCCYENTIENARLNKCMFINTICGDINSIKENNYDIILANINKNIIMNDISIYKDLLNDGGQLIIGGFYVEDIIEINKKAKPLGLELVSKKSKKFMHFHVLYKSLIFSSKPKINPEDDIQQVVQTDREHELVLYNDDVNTFDHVINTLVAVCDHSIMQAQQCAYIIHFSGKCVVKTGSISVLEPQCIKLLEAGLSAEII